MDLSRIYTKTSKGVLDGNLRTRALGRAHARLLALIDGKTSVGDLFAAASMRLSENRLAAILDELAEAGLIRLISASPEVDDLGFSSTIIVSEANTQAFFDAQVDVENKKLRRAEDQAALALANAALLKEVTADIAAEAKVLKRQDAERRAQVSAAEKNQQKLQQQSPARVAGAAQAPLKPAQVVAPQAGKPAPQATRPLATAARQARDDAEEKERLAKATAALVRRELQAKIQSEEVAQRSAELAARLQEMEQAKIQAQTLSKSLDEARIAAELETRVKRRLEARAREEADTRARLAAEAEAKLEAERKTRIEAEEKVRQVEAQALATQKQAAAEAQVRAEEEARRQALEAERKTRIEAEEKVRQAEAQALAAQKQAAVEAQARAEEEARRQAEAKAEAKLEGERKVRLEAEEKARVEAEARVKAQTEKARAVAEKLAAEEAKARAVEQARREAEAAARAKLEAEQKAQAEARAEAEALARQQAEELARRQVANEARALASAEAAARQEAEAAKRQMEEQQRVAEAQRAHEAQRAREAAERTLEAERQARALAESTARALADERAQMAAAAQAREQDQQRAREVASAKARAEMEEALRRAQAEKQHEEQDEVRLRAQAQARALAAARAAPLPFLTQRKRKPWRFSKYGYKPFAIALVGLLLVGVGLAHLLSFDFYIPKLERQLAQSLGQRVTIQDIHFSIYPAPHLVLDGVAIGDVAMVRIARANLFPALSSWFTDQKLMRRVELESVTFAEESTDALPIWSRNQARTVPMQFERLRVKDAKFSHRLLDVFTFDAELEARRGRFIQARMQSTDQRIAINFIPLGDALRIELNASKSLLPLEPRLPFETLKVVALAQAGTLTLSSIDAQLFDGYLSGTAQISGVKGWAFTADLGLQQIAVAPGLAHFTRESKLMGTLEAKVRLAAQAETLEALFTAPQVQATFRVKNGEFSGIDLGRAIQAPSRSGTTGGKTHFNDLSGYFQLAKGRYQYRQIKLQGGVVSAFGNLEVSPERNLSGNFVGELRTRSAKLRMPFTFAGSLASPMLKVALPASRRVVPPPATEAPAETAAETQ